MNDAKCKKLRAEVHQTWREGDGQRQFGVFGHNVETQ